ncbi:hypothetical protein BKA82DRAFT_4071907, partial [Pisolithus tinctorius]
MGRGTHNRLRVPGYFSALVLQSLVSHLFSFLSPALLVSAKWEMIATSLNIHTSYVRVLTIGALAIYRPFPRYYSCI